MNTSTTTNELLSPSVGDFLVLDGGNAWGTLLCQDDGFSDNGFPGCQFRTSPHHTGLHGGLAVNVVVTGRNLRWNSKGGFMGVRVKVEFVGDCEPSTFVGGWVKLNS